MCMATGTFGIMGFFVGVSVDFGRSAVVAQPHIIIDGLCDVFGVFFGRKEFIVLFFIQFVHGVPAVLACPFSVPKFVHAVAYRQIDEKIEKREYYSHDFQCGELIFQCLVTG